MLNIWPEAFSARLRVGVREYPTEVIERMYESGVESDGAASDTLVSALFP